MPYSGTSVFPSANIKTVVKIIQSTTLIMLGG